MRIIIIFLFSSSFAFGQCDLSCAEIKNCINAEYINSVIDEPVENLDNDPTNELQTISESGGVVTLSNGGGSFNLTEECPTPNTTTFPVDITDQGTASIFSQNQSSYMLRYIEDQNCNKKEWHRWRVTLRVNQTDANGWAILRVPTVAGYTREVRDITTYRRLGEPNEDDNLNGAMPDNTYFGQEAGHALNGVIYMNQFRNKDEDAEYFIYLTIEYFEN